MSSPSQKSATRRAHHVCIIIFCGSFRANCFPLSNGPSKREQYVRSELMSGTRKVVVTLFAHPSSARLIVVVVVVVVVCCCWRASAASK